MVFRTSPKAFGKGSVLALFIAVLLLLPTGASAGKIFDFM